MLLEEKRKWTSENTACKGANNNNSPILKMCFSTADAIVADLKDCTVDPNRRYVRLFRPYVNLVQSKKK